MSQWYLDLLHERYDFNLVLGKAITTSAFVTFFLVCISFPSVLVYLAAQKALAQSCGPVYPFIHAGTWTLFVLNNCWQSLVLLIAVVFLAEDKQNASFISNSYSHQDLDTTIERDISLKNDSGYLTPNETPTPSGN